MAVSGVDDRKAIPNATVYPYTAIAQLQVTFPNGATYVSTGFFVDSSHVMTSGNQLYAPSLGGWATSITVTPDRIGSTFPYSQGHMVSMHAPNGWTANGDENFDYGLVTLDQFFGTGTFGYSSNTDAALLAAPVNVAGYSNDIIGNTFMSGSSGRIATLTPRILVGDATLDTSGGYIGGPLWTNRADGPWAVGVYAGSDGTANYFTRITASVVSDINFWIDSDIAGAVSGTLRGTAANDRLVGTAANDDIAGGAGRDTVVEPGKFADATFRTVYDGLTRFITSAGGQDWLQSVERVRFDDGVLILDGGTHGAEAYRLYQAAFARQPDEAGLMVQVGVLNAGLPLLGLAAAFLTTDEFKAKYGVSATDADFVTAMYRNVLGRTPDAGGLSVQVDALAHGLSRAQMLVNFSESAENLNITGAYTRNGLFTTIVDTSLG